MIYIYIFGNVLLKSSTIFPLSIHLMFLLNKGVNTHWKGVHLAAGGTLETLFFLTTNGFRCILCYKLTVTLSGVVCSRGSDSGLRAKTQRAKEPEKTRGECLPLFFPTLLLATFFTLAPLHEHLEQAIFGVTKETNCKLEESWTISRRYLFDNAQCKVILSN